MRTIALLMALGRTAFGATLLLRPKLISRAWLGEDAERPAADMLMRVGGARDLAIGLGAVLAIMQGQKARGWIEAGVLADAADTAITLAYLGKLPTQGALTTLAMTIPAVLLGWRTARQVDADLEARVDRAKAEAHLANFV